VAEGTPEDIAVHPTSYTGVFLAPVLAERPGQQLRGTTSPRTSSTTATKTPRKVATKKTAKKAMASKATARKTVTRSSA